jgi:hypothetical protein
MTNILSIILGLALCLSSLALAVQGYHHVNGLFIPMVLGVAGSFMALWSIACECWGL